MKQLEQALHADTRVPVTLPRATGREEDFVFVALNGKGYTIRRGQTVLVPLCMTSWRSLSASSSASRPLSGSSRKTPPARPPSRALPICKEGAG